MSLPEIKVKVSVLAYEKRKPLTDISQLNNDAAYVTESQLQSELLEMREWVRQQFLGGPPTIYVDCGSVINRGLPIAQSFKGSLPADFSEE